MRPDIPITSRFSRAVMLVLLVGKSKEEEAEEEKVDGVMLAKVSGSA